MLISEKTKVFLACGVTDMRKSINGLSALVEGNLSLDPFEEALFVFCNRERNRLKILQWDQDGFWLWFKRLERGRFKWPTSDTESSMELSREEFRTLLGSPKVEQKLRRKQLKISHLF